MKGTIPGDYLINNKIKETKADYGSAGTFNHLSSYMLFQFFHKKILELEIRYGKKYGPILYAVSQLNTHL